MKKIYFVVIALVPAVAFGAGMSTYPTKTTPASADKVPISDSASSNATKNITVGSIWDNIPGTSLSAASPLSLSQSTGALSIDLSAYILKTAIDTQSEFEAYLGWSLPTGQGATDEAVTSDPYSDVACVRAKYNTSNNRRFPCINGYHTAYVLHTAYTNTSPVSYTLTITSPSHGTITYSGTDPLNCGTAGSDCTTTATSGTALSGITAVADSGYSFSTWSGDVTGAAYNDGAVTLNANKTASATFASASIPCGGSEIFLRGANASGTTESFEYGTDDYCSNNWTVSSTTGLNPYSTGYSKFGTHSLALTDDTSATAGRVYVDHGSAQTSQYYRAYVKIPTLVSGGNFNMFGVARYGTALGMPISVYNSSGHKLRLSGSTSEYVAVTAGNEYRVELRADDSDGSGTGTVKLYMRVFDSSGNAVETTNGGGDTEVYVDSGVAVFQYFMLEPSYNSATAATVYIDGVKNCNTWCGGE